VLKGNFTSNIEQKKDKKPLYESYIWALENRGKEIKRIFDVLTNKDHYPIVIHCYAGKDRTGIIIALIHLLIGTSRDSIKQDYIISSTENKISDIQAIMTYVDNKGGINNYLENIGTSKHSQEKILQSLTAHQDY